MSDRVFVPRVECAIKCLKDKFLQSPYAFYTESGMHCYLYSLLYQERLLKEPMNVRVGRRGRSQVVQTVRLHKEYPTLGKFCKRVGKTLVPDENDYVTVDGRKKQPSRGAYDLAIVDPDETRFQMAENKCSDRTCLKRTSSITLTPEK